LDMGVSGKGVGTERGGGAGAFERTEG
jgi:hypothetical protein